MKMMKKALFVMLTVAIIACAFAVCSVTGSATEIIVSGRCGAEGDNVVGTLYSDGLLVISGKGDMAKDWADDEFPWSAYYKNITSISIECGVSSIGANSFSDTSITEINIPDSVESIGSGAFYGCSNLTEIIIPDSVTSIGTWAFSSCSSLKNISIPDSVEYIATNAFYGSGLEKIVINNPKCVIEYSASTIPVDAVIYGYADSPAQMYAQMYGRDFVALAAAACTHSYGEWIIDADASCTQRGFAHRVCAFCNGYEFDVLDETGHADEDADGCCDVCDAIISAQTPDTGDNSETQTGALSGFLNSITEFFNRIIAWIKSLFGMA